MFILLAVFGVAGWRIISLSNNLTKTDLPADNGQNNEAILPQEATLIIDNAIDYQSLSLAISASTTAFDLLLQASQQLNLDVESKSYDDLGIFIEAIGEQKNGQDNKYWLYYINGEMPMIASDKYLVQPGDLIEFKFEESPF